MLTLLRVLVIWVIAALLARPILVGPRTRTDQLSRRMDRQQTALLSRLLGHCCSEQVFCTRLFCGRRGIFVGPHLSRTRMPMEFHTFPAFNSIQSAKHHVHIV